VDGSFLGDSSAAGGGVDHQREALASQAAGHLARRLRRFVRRQLVARSGGDTVEALDLPKRSTVERAGVIVTTLGTNDMTSQQSPRVFARNFGRLLKEGVEWGPVPSP
jgi:lysophospholipase L1-like esterase